MHARQSPFHHPLIHGSVLGSLYTHTHRGVAHLAAHLYSHSVTGARSVICRPRALHTKTPPPCAT